MNFSQDYFEFIKEHENDDIHKLALQSNLYPHIDLLNAITQIQGRKIAKEKIPYWYSNENLIYSKHLSMEQCSSQHTACYKSTLCKGEKMVDLTGGFGIDFSFLSSKFEEAIYIEQQKELCEIATHNFKNLPLKNVSIINTDGVEYLKSMPNVDFIYIDPARRNESGNKIFAIEDCTPNIIDIQDLLLQKAEKVMIKLSPMLDISLAVKSLKNISDIHIISHNNECKELVFILRKNYIGLPQFNCVSIIKGKTDILNFKKDQEQTYTINYANSVGEYIYEPNSSIMKAGAYKTIANHFLIDKLHPNSHLYTSDKLLTDFYGRKFKVSGVYNFNKKTIKGSLNHIKQANLSIRNFPLSTDELRKKLQIKDGGEIYIFATTLRNEQKVLIICDKLKE